MKEKDDRDWTFVEFLSAYLVIFSSVGALLVMIDPVIVYTMEGGTQIKLGGDGFAEQMKGAVTQLVLIGGFTAVIAFWLRISKAEEKVQSAIADIAKEAAPAQVKAVAAARAPALSEAPPTDVVTPGQPTTQQVADGITPAAAVADVGAGSGDAHASLVAFEDSMATKYGKDWNDSSLTPEETTEYTNLRKPT